MDSENETKRNEESSESENVEKGVLGDQSSEKESSSVIKEDTTIDSPSSPLSTNKEDDSNAEKMECGVSTNMNDENMEDRNRNESTSGNTPDEPQENNEISNEKDNTTSQSETEETMKEKPVSVEDKNLDSPETSQSSNTPQTVQCSDEQELSIYHLKWFEWKGLQTPIVTQNENGPCPLLAIANVLILARKIELPPMQQIISGKQLMEYIGDCILASAPDQDGNDELMLNYQQNMQDAIDIMYKLQTGIDVNVKFTGVCEFEFTRECIVFDLLKIALYHGWLVDPQDSPTASALKTLSYNQAVEKMVTAKDSTDDTVVSEAFVIEEFINRSASQLTYHGLCELNDTVHEEELCVFFRNNHFSTLYKHKGELFLLVTDQGFLTEPAVIWETLANIEGDGQFVNSEFRSITLQSNAPPPSPPINSANTATTTPSLVPSQPSMLPGENMTQEDQDYLIALSLQEEHGGGMPQQDAVQTKTNVDSDHALALRLQEDEDRRAIEEVPQQQQQPQQPQQQQQQQQQQLNIQQRQQQQQPRPQQQQSESSQARGGSSQNCSIL